MLFVLLMTKDGSFNLWRQDPAIRKVAALRWFQKRCFNKQPVGTECALAAVSRALYDRFSS